MADNEPVEQRAARSAALAGNPEALRSFNDNLAEEFRANRGQVGGVFAGVPLLLLTTTGAKSGQPRTSPLAYSVDGGRLVIIASLGGAPRNPAWYFNLVTNPLAIVEVGTERYEVQATEAKGPERDRLYEQQAEQLPVFKEYVKKTSRVIPVFVLDRL
jgi:deazaflavin-dependent oxidoreductase (nitroreductase family)